MIIEIDSGEMFFALQDDGPAATGYLNRRTGEIRFIWEDEGQAVELGSTAAEAVFDRAEVEGNPEVWIEIPKWDYHSHRPEPIGFDPGPNCWIYKDPHWKDSSQQKFIAEFLKKNGIEAKLT